METQSNSTLDEAAGPPKRGDTPKRSTFRRILLAVGQIGVSFIVLSVIVTLPLRWIHPVTTSFILQDRAASSAEMRRMWTPFEEMSQHLPIAVVAAEDQMFPFHHGFDLESISKAMNEERDRPRGASTISMQLAKNLYLWPGRSMLRKGLEAWFTVLIELFWPKERILEVYLNVVEFGNGIYGAESASRYHFGKSVSQLGTYESALLAAVLPSPRRMSAGSPSSYVYRRATQITSEVRRLGGSGYLVSGQPPVRR
jgi:monofunctional biosynthetic peptidoglycan transglycosylase